MSEMIFAYGTLLTGALDPAIDRVIARHCRRRGHARVRGQLLDLGDYPGAVKGEGWIAGELLELQAPQRHLPLFDDYEGFDPLEPRRSLYLRERVRALPPDDETGGWDCWIYWLRQIPDAPRIERGDWVAHVEGR